MKRPHFKACNHRCSARKATGVMTNGRCKFPSLVRLEEISSQLWAYHEDKEIRQFAGKVYELLRHIEMREDEG